MSEIEQEIADHVKREVSTSAQRLRGLFRSRVPLTGAPVAPAPSPLVKAQLGVVLEKLTEPDASTAPAAPAVTTTAAAMPLPSFLQPKVKPMATNSTGKAQTFADRLKAVHTKLDADMDAGISAIEAIEQKAADTNAKISKIVATKTADLASLDDVLNQLSNGAPDDDEAETQPSTGTTA